MFKFITHRPLWVNILVGLVLALAIFFLFLSSLKCLTGHGKAAAVPSVTGKTYEEAKLILKKAGFHVDIQDSIYVDTMRPMSVIKQIPDADEMVKSNRTIFLVVSRAVPPVEEMPNLIGYSFRNAEMVLKNLGMKIGDTTFKPDFAKNSIMEQWYNGSQIAPGTKIRRGSSISLVLSDGLGEREFAVPTITGMKFCDVKELLEEYGVVLGSIVKDANVSDTCNAWVYKQNPERFTEDKKINHIRSGQTMDLWLQIDKPSRRDSLDADNPSPLE